MTRYGLAVYVLFFTSFAVAQNTASDPRAQALATKSFAALGGTALGDVALTANVTSTRGSSVQTGTATLIASSTNSSRVELNLGDRQRTDVQNGALGIPAGGWSTNGGPLKPYASHNSFTDASWFFPTLSSLTQVNAPKFVFNYLGQEQRQGATIQHLRASKILPQDPQNKLNLWRLGAVEFYLDSVTSLPVALTFNIHPDNDANRDIPVEVRFSDYRPVQGMQVPYHIQRLVNGEIELDIVVTNVAFDSGVTATSFSVQ